MTTVSLPYLETLQGEELNLYNNLHEAYSSFEKDGDPTALTRQVCREILKFKSEDGTNLMDNNFYSLFFNFATQVRFEMYPSESCLDSDEVGQNEFVADISLPVDLGRVIATFDYDDDCSNILIVLAIPGNKSAILRVTRDDVGIKVTYIENM